MKDYNNSVEGNYDAQGVTLEDQHGEVYDWEREERWNELAERFNYNPLD